MTSVGLQIRDMLRAEREPARCTCGHYQAVHRPLIGPETDRNGPCTAGAYNQPCICDRFTERGKR